MRLPKAFRISPARAKSASLPPQKMVSVPFSAPSDPPETGASTIPIPRSASRAAMSAVADGDTVEQSTTRPPLARPSATPPGPSSTCSRSGVSETQVKTASAACAASAGDAARSAPSAASGSSRSRVRLCTVTSCPASIRCRAMGPPIVPRPITATRMPGAYPERTDTPPMRLTPDIVTAIQELALAQRSVLGVRAQWHVGDLAWNLSPHQGHELDMRFWDEDGRLVAWSWVQHDGRLEYDVHPDRLRLLDEILATADARSAFAFADDAQRRAALERHGFTQPGDAMHYFARDLAEPPSPAPLPDGFRARTVSTGDVPERVAIHQDV